MTPTTATAKPATMPGMNIINHIFGPEIGLTRREIDSWNWTEFIDAAGRQDVKRLGFYQSVSDATVAKRGRIQEDLRCYAIPADVLTRDMTVASGGNHLVSAETPFFLPSFLGRSLTATLPLRRIRGLQGNVTIPRGVGGTTTTWLSDEGAQIAESVTTTGMITLVPKSVTANCDVTHQLSIQAGPDGGQHIIDELILGLGRASDVALLAGSGVSGQPMSPFKTPGAGSAAGAAIAWSSICSLTTSAEATQVGADRPSWVLGVNAASVLRQREKASGGGFVFDDGRIAGYEAMVSSAAPTASIYLADWTSIVMGSWGSLEIAVDPFADFTRGLKSVRAWLSVDFGCLNSAGLSFADSVS